MMELDFGGPVDVPFEPWTYAELDHGVIARFRRVARAHASLLAIDDGGACWTYRQLANAVECVRGAIESESAAGEPVAIESDNSRFVAAAMLGALAAGRPYVPVDPSFPVERNRHIQEHSGARLVMTRAWLEDCCSGPPPLIDGCAGTGASIAYILYTSGSTGRPKGVYQTQRNLLHDVMQYVHSVHLSARDGLTMLYSASVNGAIRDLYGALLTGASLHMHSVRQAGFARLRERMVSGKITVYHSVPPVFRAFLQNSDFFDAVRIVYLAGDRVEAGDVERFRRHFPRGAKLYTGIGATEVATLYRQWFLDHDTPVDGCLPVGRAIPDREVKLVDGVIEISSRYLALGYWRDPELTAQHFQTTPGEPDVRTFRSGDRGRERPDGLLEFLGRSDQQVKIRGHRVEIAEVESALSTHKHTGEVAVMMDGEKLVAFYTGTVDIEWGEFLTARLPAHMIPSRFERVKELPRLGNFKLDRRALAQSYPGAPPMAGWLEATVAEVFGTLLGQSGIGPESDFSALGGDSLLKLRVLTELEARLGRMLPTSVLAEAFNSRNIAKFIERAAKDASPTVLYVPSIDGAMSGVEILAEAFAGYHVLGLNYPSGGEESIEGIASSLHARLKRQELAEPYTIVGYSFGARVAFELARQLERSGRQVEFLCVIDTPPCGPLEIAQSPAVTRALRLARRAAGSPVALWPGILRHVWKNNLRPRVLRSNRPVPEAHASRRAAFLEYQPGTYEGKLVLLRARGENLGWESLPEDLGWSEWCHQVQVHFFDGTHDIASPASAASLNRILREEMVGTRGPITTSTVASECSLQ